MGTPLSDAVFASTTKLVSRTVTYVTPQSQLRSPRGRGRHRRGALVVDAPSPFSLQISGCGLNLDEPVVEGDVDFTASHEAQGLTQRPQDDDSSGGIYSRQHGGNFPLNRAGG